MWCDRPEAAGIEAVSLGDDEHESPPEHGVLDQFDLAVGETAASCAFHVRLIPSQTLTLGW